MQRRLRPSSPLIRRPEQCLLFERRRHIFGLTRLASFREDRELFFPPLPLAFERPPCSEQVVHRVFEPMLPPPLFVGILGSVLVFSLNRTS